MMAKSSAEVSGACLNFSAGPSALPSSVWAALQEEIALGSRRGFNIFEISHHDEQCLGMVAECQLLLRNLLQIPDSHEILFMQGGARQQYDYIPLNLLTDRASSAYYQLTVTRPQPACK